MSTTPLINSLTKRHLEDYLTQPSSVLLLTGAKGAGKKYLALLAGGRLLGAPSDGLINKGRLLVLPAGAGIDDVRQIIKEVSIKAASTRAVIINEADKLGHEAQNALLKTLEELPPRTFFILTSSSPNSLLATIRSRAQTVVVKPLTLTETKAAFRNLPLADTERAWLLGEGLAAQLNALLVSESPQLKTAAESAKEFLGLDSYNRIIFLDKNIADRDGLILFLSGLKRILKAASLLNAQKGNSSALNRLTASRRLVVELTDKANSNSSTKLINLQLATSLKV